jgi:SAM-dependent methyltransferase
MLAGMQLDVFTPLKDGPMTAGQIGEAIGTRPDRLRLLLYALTAAGLLDVKDGVFSNSAEAARFLVRGSPDYLGNMQTRVADQWRRKLKTAESIKSGKPQAQLDFSHSPPEELEAFFRRVNAQTVVTACGLIEHCDFSSIRTLADVGGGAGGLAITVAKAFPHIKATVVDLPLVTAVTQKVVEEEDAADRVEVLTADVVKGPLPGSYDAAVVKGVLQVLSAEDARSVLVNVGRAIKPGGVIYIVGEILDNSRTSPPEAVGFNLVFINMYETGEAYTEQEHRDWLTDAGFVDVSRPKLSLPNGHGLMTARKPL